MAVDSEPFNLEIQMVSHPEPSNVPKPMYYVQEVPDHISMHDDFQKLDEQDDLPYLTEEEMLGRCEQLMDNIQEIYSEIHFLTAVVRKRMRENKDK
jgi:hypothetical protein